MRIFFIELRYKKLLERADEFGYQFNADFDREKGLRNNIRSFISSTYNTSFFNRLQSFIPGTKAYAYRNNIAANLDTLSEFIRAAPITMLARKNIINTYQDVLVKRDRAILAYSPQLQLLKKDSQAKDDKIKELESEIKDLQSSLKNSERQIDVLENNAGQAKRNYSDKSPFFKSNARAVNKAKTLTDHACKTRERIPELQEKRNVLLNIAHNATLKVRSS